MSRFPTLTRRGFLGAALASAALGCGRTGRAAPFDAGTAAQCTVTGADIEGPFFKAGAPSRAAFADANTPGRALVLGGRVLDAQCRPIAGAAVELWQADHAGGYDNRGFRFRGTLRTGDDGIYQVATIVPGRYLNGRQYRPAHIHAKVHADGFTALTTQLYFPDDPYNDADPWFDEARLVTATERNGRIDAGFDFVLA